MSTEKIEFRLEVEDGFPPISVESLNARLIDGDRFEMLNTPFFAQNVAYGDVVVASRHHHGGRVFRSVETYSGFRAISLMLFDHSLDAHLLDLLRGLECVIEYGEFGALRMLAVGIPSAVDYGPIKVSLDEFQRLGHLSYAELVA